MREYRRSLIDFAWDISMENINEDSLNNLGIQISNDSIYFILVIGNKRSFNLIGLQRSLQYFNIDC